MSTRPEFDSVGEHTLIHDSVEVFRQGEAEGRGIFVGSSCIIYPRNRLVLGDLSVNAEAILVIGDHVLMNAGGYFSGEGGLSIGDYTLIGPSVCVLSAGHAFDDPSTLIQRQGLTYGRITIGRDVWIGAGAVILPGVAIGDGAVVASGAVIADDVPADGVMVGNPARLFRYRGKPRQNGFARRIRKAWDVLFTQ